jgi:hypothetical protein
MSRMDLHADKVAQFLHDNPRSTIDAVAGCLGVSTGYAHLAIKHLRRRLADEGSAFNVVVERYQECQWYLFTDDPHLTHSWNDGRKHSIKEQLITLHAVASSSASGPAATAVDRFEVRMIARLIEDIDEMRNILEM